MEHDWNDFPGTIPEITGFRVRDFENLWSEQIHVANPHELLYVIDGKVTLIPENGLRFPALAGDFLLVPALVPHRDVFEPLKGLRVLIIKFAWEKAEQYFTQVTNRRLCDLSFATRIEVRRQLEYMRENWENTPLGCYSGNVQLLSILLFFYRDLIRNPAQNSAVSRLPILDVVRQAKQYVDQNYALPISLDMTARHLGICGQYLSKLFKHEYGVNFSEYLTEIRLEAAAKLLRHGKLQVAEVASRCGFSSSSYFIQIFRNHFGVTPRNYLAKKTV